MPHKSRKRTPVPGRGLAPGESLSRYLVPTANLQSARWTWIGSEAHEETDITPEHCLIACGLSSRNSYPFCQNRYTTSQTHEQTEYVKEKSMPDDDIIVVHDDDEAVKCTRSGCKENPNCLNYLGQDKWEDEETAMREFLKAASLGLNPTEDTRTPDFPVGLKNLGATCYANASLQVWFRNLTFRQAVYECQPQNATGSALKDSPIFQLQSTFAALQNGSCKVFNPASLVESLQLRTAEQQDAQEFSKLFMSHLDSEFKKQATPELRSLVSDLFQGNQIYGTRCDTCQYRSERTADFLEIEIRFEHNSTLGDCITAMLQEEKLIGDNQYDCPQCNGLRDATRFMQLRRLPPVLNFSLLRFIYDFSTMERRKSKYTISFPTSIDMNRFLEHDTQDHDKDANVYELTGILLHKGASAYHGHYEAQVYDTEKQSWFQFNDEVVTEIRAPGDKQKGSKHEPIVIDDGDPPSSQSKCPAKKKRKIVREDDGETDRMNFSIPSKVISSKDAYMLIYVRRRDQRSRSIGASVPHEQAWREVDALNRAHETKCTAYHEKREWLRAQFTSTRQQVMDVYKTWDARSVDDDSVVLSSTWLRNWLSQDCMRLAKPVQIDGEAETGNDATESSNGPSSKPEDSIICEHRFLDPTKAKDFKRIKRAVYQKMVELTGSRYEPLLSPHDVCRQCVLMEFKERLYKLRHPKLVQEFDKVSGVDDNTEGYWISKNWIKDWRLIRPKMHRASQEDPAPDSPEFQRDIWCEHGSLTLNSFNRRKISFEGGQVLKKLFPLWEPLRSDFEPCAVCATLAHVSKEDKRELRRRAEEEKALLRCMYEETPFTNKDDSFAIISTDFFKGWILWLNSPADHARSDTLDNSCFLCEHELLVFDPNCPSDTEMIITIIRQSDWDILEKLYDTGPCISLKKIKEDDSQKLRYESVIPVCEDCRLKRKTEWVSTDIIVHLLRGKKRETSTNRQPIAALSNKNWTRHSMRLRQAHDDEKRRFAVTRKTTIKDIKVKIQESFKMPTVSQRVFFRGQELQDNETTVEELQVFANEVLQLREESEVHEFDSDRDDQSTNRKRKRETERGFGGTLLSSGVAEAVRYQGSDSCEETPHVLSPMSSKKVCAACTLLNAHDAIACQICDTPFV